MSRVYKAKVFESKPQHICNGDIINIDATISQCISPNYVIIDGTLNGAIPGNYVVELVQLRNNVVLPKYKYTYISSKGESTIEYGFAFELCPLTTNIEINIYMVVE